MACCRLTAVHSRVNREKERRVGAVIAANMHPPIHLIAAISLIIAQHQSFGQTSFICFFLRRFCLSSALWCCVALGGSSVILILSWRHCAVDLLSRYLDLLEISDRIDFHHSFFSSKHQERVFCCLRKYVCSTLTLVVVCHEERVLLFFGVIRLSRWKYAILVGIHD